jgi:hypothetical protein
VQQELHATSSFAFKKSIYELTAVKPQDYLHIKTKIEDYKKQLEKSKNNKNSRMLKVGLKSFFDLFHFYFIWLENIYFF